MPYTFSHAVVAIAAGTACAPQRRPRLFWPCAIICATIADADLIGFLFGVPNSHFLGHRGFSHSLFFGLLVSIVLTAYLLHDTHVLSRRWLSFLAFFFLVSASHGILDAMTTGSIGVALLSPFDTTRYFFPWRPISMMHIRVFLRTWSFAAIKSEILWVWVPSLFVILLSLVTRSAARRYGVRA